MTTITIERELLDEIVELFDSAITARFPHEILRDLRAALAAPATALVVTKNESGQIVAVTRQDEDGRIVEVLAESAPAPASEPVAWMTDEIQPRVASDYTKSNMPSAVAVSFSIPLYRVSPATAPDQPAWHDAPTCAGLWWVAGTAGIFHIDEAALPIYKGSAHRWFGPIPPDSGDKP